MKRKTPARVTAVQERRRSGAAGIHVNKGARRARTRSAARNRAIKEFS